MIRVMARLVNVDQFSSHLSSSFQVQAVGRAGEEEESGGCRVNFGCDTFEFQSTADLSFHSDGCVFLGIS